MDLGHHEIGDDNGDNHGVILVDGVDAFEVFVGKCDGRESSW